MASGVDGPAGSARRPVGIVAAALAAAIAVGGLMAGQAYALRLAEQHLAGVAAGPLPIKYETLTFQRAAFAVSGELPIYGSSELFCCGQPDLPTEFFANAPAGFHPFTVGRAGTGDLMFLETFGALGSAVAGRRVVVSVSPQWYYGKAGITAGYNGNFSPEIADVFTYDAPLPLALHEAAARQMAAHPATLAGQGLLRLGVRALASGDLPLYYALLPAGRIDAWAQQLKDAWQTIAFVRGMAAGSRAGPALAAGTARGSGGASAPAAALASGKGSAAGSAAGSASGSTPGSASGSAPGSTSGSTPRSVSSSTPRSTPQSAPGSAPRSAARQGPARVPLSAPASPSRSRAPGLGSPRVAAPLAIRPVGAPRSARALLAALTRQAGAPPAGAAIDWRAKLAAATRLENTLAGSDPFGFDMNARSLARLEPALRLYCAGASNAAGGVYPYPAKWAATMASSAEWTALGLELRALRDLGAKALVWTVPFQGYYDNYTQLSQAARLAYYDRFLQVTAPAGFPAVSFAQADEDRLFIANVGNHFSPRGWVVADRALDLFWHGQAAAIPATVAAMTRLVPPPPPARRLACPTQSGGIVHAGSGAAG